MDSTLQRYVTQAVRRKLQQACCLAVVKTMSGSHSHRLLRLDDNKPAASCQQA